MKQGGFNLIELCVCMTIIIILSGTCFYGYQQHQQELARKHAELNLADRALSLQEHEDPKNGFSNLSLATLGFAETEDHYSYTLTANNNSFIISAKPDFSDQCGSLSLNNQGLRTSENNQESCWN